jgi:hypothetical protein
LLANFCIFIDRFRIGLGFWVVLMPIFWFCGEGFLGHIGIFWGFGALFAGGGSGFWGACFCGDVLELLFTPIRPWTSIIFLRNIIVAVPQCDGFANKRYSQEGGRSRGFSFSVPRTCKGVWQINGFWVDFGCFCGFGIGVEFCEFWMLVYQKGTGILGVIECTCGWMLELVECGFAGGGSTSWGTF